MATRKRTPNPVYASASARVDNGYGHLTIHIHEAFGSIGTIKIDCQCGGISPGETYSWKHGVSNDYDVLGVHALHKSFLLMRAMAKKLAQEYTDHGNAKNYAEYALRVLRAAGVRKVYLRPGVNSTFYGDVKTLHPYDPIKQGDMLKNELHNMEQAIIGRTS